ncbi:hypothetical protein GCM10028798_16800 [Humibacter antri]
MPQSPLRDSGGVSILHGEGVTELCRQWLGDPWHATMLSESWLRRGSRGALVEDPTTRTPGDDERPPSERPHALGAVGEPLALSGEFLSRSVAIRRDNDGYGHEVPVCGATGQRRPGGARSQTRRSPAAQT